MPNYVRNLIKVADGDFQALTDFMKSETSDFDFNKLIPMPPSMLYLKKYNGISKQSELGFKYWSAAYKSDKYALINEINRCGFDLRQTLREGLDRLYAYAESGHWNSLDWAIANWGTKWNSFDIVVMEGIQTFVIHTAWTAPIPIFEALCRQFPTNTFFIKYADFEGGWFSGEGIGHGGEYHDTCYEEITGRGKEVMDFVENYLTL